MEKGKLEKPAEFLKRAREEALNARKQDLEKKIGRTLKAVTDKTRGAGGKIALKSRKPLRQGEKAKRRSEGTTEKAGSKFLCQGGMETVFEKRKREVKGGREAVLKLEKQKGRRESRAFVNRKITEKSPENRAAHPQSRQRKSEFERKYPPGKLYVPK